MRIIAVGTKYESKIYVLDDEKIIFKVDCICGDFAHRRIKKVGEFADIKYYAEPCKHLEPFVEALKKQGYTLKKPKEMVGPDILPSALRRKLMENADHQCEAPGCEAKAPLTVHRKTRSSNGGKYNKENCVVLCVECHKARHAGEFN